MGRRLNELIEDFVRFVKEVGTFAAETEEELQKLRADVDRLRAEVRLMKEEREK